MNTSDQQYDVVILGSGFAGGMLGAILARQGVKVLILDGGGHPRFAIGESTVRHTLRMVKMMAVRYDVPELEYLSTYHQIRDHISSACGEKRNFGYLYHREGQEQNPREANQLVIPPFRIGYEAHMFRQDIDAYLTNVAIHYGATVKLHTPVKDVQIDQSGVEAESVKGEKFRARYLVDATGFRSVIADKLGLREKPTRLKTHSRSIFTHMIDVLPYDQVQDAQKVHGMPSPWHKGTLHHIFDGGWLWVIPFNNHEKSTNNIISVGLQLDPRKYPKTGLSPQAEFEDWLSRFPSVARQFKHAKPVRDWVSTDRLQYSATKVAGYRFCLMSHATGFLDPLFSRGLANTTEAINAFAPLLLKALADDDFSEERFAYVERLQQNTIDHNDELVHGSYISWRDYDLWNAWFRVWVTAVTIGEMRLTGILRKYKRTHDERILPDADEPLGLFYNQHQSFQSFWQAVNDEIRAVEEERISSKEGTQRIFKILKTVNFMPPAFRIWDPNRRYMHMADPKTMLHTFLWLARQAPPEIRDFLINPPPGPHAKLLPPAGTFSTKASVPV